MITMDANAFQRVLNIAATNACLICMTLTRLCKHGFDIAIRLLYI